MAALGLGDIAAFPFVEPPDARSDQGRDPPARGAGGARPRAARRDHVRLTKVGRRLARIPADPRLARMVLEADRHGVVAEVLVLAAALSIQDPRERPTGERAGGRRSSTGASPTPSPTSSAYLNLWRYLREQQKARGSSQFRRMCKAEHLHHLRIREWQDVHSQLRQVARGIGLEVRPLADEPDRDGDPPVAARRACCPTSGCSTRTATSTAAPGRPGSCSRPGTALGKRRPKWVMAAELVETNRLRARTVAQITPDRIEQAAGHLVTRSLRRAVVGGGARRGDDHRAGEPLRAAARHRPPRAARPRRSRRGPARCSSATRWSTATGTAAHAFVQANKEQVADVVALEERVRRDLLVSDDALVAFFDARVPADVTTARRFDRWWKGAASTRARPAHLHAGRPDRARRRCRSTWPGSPTTGAGAMPGSPLTYVLDPTSDLDGVVVDVPLPAARSRSAAPASTGRCPGHRLALVTALLRTLPKEQRRHHTPAPDVAAELLAAIGPDDGPLLDVLAGGPVRSERGRRWPPTTSTSAPCPPTSASPTAPSTTAGRPLAWSKDLPALRRRLAERVRDALAAAAPVDEVSGATAWVFGTIPRTVDRRPTPGLAVTGHPALVDEGESVGLRVLPVGGRAADGHVGRHPAPAAPAARLAAAHARPGPAQRHQARPRRAPTG